MTYTFLLCIILILLSFIVLFSNNTMTSLLALIWCFIFAGVFSILLHAEFIAFIIIIIYATAISILFLFIIMLLNLRIIDSIILEHIYIYFNYLYTIIIITIFNIYLIKGNIYYFIEYDIITNENMFWINYINIYNYKNNTYYIGIVLYNYYYIYFIISGLILFIAMIGSIFIVIDYNTKTNRLLARNTKCLSKIKNYTVNVWEDII